MNKLVKTVSAYASIAAGLLLLPVSLAGVPCTTVSECAYQLLTQRATANQSAFYVYLDADSAFNHGFASGLYFSSDIDPKSAILDGTCLDLPGSPTGCSTDLNALDRQRGTVFRFSFPALGIHDFIGLNFQDPANYARGDGSSGYNLSPATYVQFDVRSPNGATVQFGVGGCISGFFTIGTSWETLQIPLNTLHPPPGAPGACPPDITDVHLLFTVAADGGHDPNGGTVLLDNIQFLPVPVRQASDPKAFSLPLSTQTFGIVPRTANPVPTDQANRNIAAIYESALAILTLLHRGQTADVAEALKIADALEYALYHDNHGDPLPVASDGSTALHNAYMAGDIALLSSQSPQGALAGDARLAGFTGGTGLCGAGKFCLVLDGATGGNNAWAIFALAAAYIQSGKPAYLTDAERIGNWITDVLQDRSNPSYGGYFVGFNDAGKDGLQQRNLGKSTENNGDIFAAFSLLSNIEAAHGNAAAAQKWLTAANAAGDFVKRMEIPDTGGFYVGTVTVAAAADSGKYPGNCAVPASQAVGNDVLNLCEFLDSNTFTLLPMAASSRYSSLNWTAALEHVLTYANAGNTYTQQVTAAGHTLQGFDLVPAPPSSGVAYEFTGQMSATCAYLASLSPSTTPTNIQSCASSYLSQIQAAQASAPFGDGLGLVAAALPNGDTLPPNGQCFATPFQCIGERVGLAATTWAIIADAAFNPMAYPGAYFSSSQLSFPQQTVGTTSAPSAVTLTNVGIAPMKISRISISGANASEFTESDNCVSASPLAAGSSCAITLWFSPKGPGARSATLTLSSNAIAGPLSLSAAAAPVDNFSMAIMPASQVVNAGGALTYNLTTAITAGVAQPVMLSASGLPVGVSVSFTRNSISSGASTSMTISTAPNVVPGCFSFNVNGAGPEVSQSASATVCVQPAFTQSMNAMAFPTQDIFTTSAPQTLTITNPGTVPLPLSLLMAGPNALEFSQSSNCPAVLASLSSCSVIVIFKPAGTGLRSGFLMIQSTMTAGQQVALTGTGVGTCSTISTCAYKLLAQRVWANSSAFYVYQDADAGVNHGVPSGLFGSFGFDLSKVILNSGCVDSPTSPTGCSSDANAIDITRGTVFSITFPAGLTGNQYAGLAFLEPSNYSPTAAPIGYDLRPAAAVQFDVRAPHGATVQFGVGGCVTPDIQIGPAWTTKTISLSSHTTPGFLTLSCIPDMASVHILFSITADFSFSAGGPVLLDNIQFTPIPDSQTKVVSLPLSTQTFGVTPALNYPIPTDQVNRNIASTYEAALTALALFTRGNSQDNEAATLLANSLHYALHHDNSGDPVPVFGNSSGLHSAYESGDLAFLNPQDPAIGPGKAGDVRFSGFSASSDLCGASQFCLVLDGATGGNNAWAIIALASAYIRTGNAIYLQDAEALGNWIVSALADTSGTGYGGYFLGFSDGGTPKVLQVGKSTEQNATIFAALGLLARIEAMRGNAALSAAWAAHAKTAGDFVMAMWDPAGRFNTGTINNVYTSGSSPGICPSTTQSKGPDTINTCDFLDANTISALAMSGSAAYKDAIDWTLPVKYLSTFRQTANAGGVAYQGFGEVLPSIASGIAWEFTAQAVLANKSLLPAIASSSIALQSMLTAQNSAPFGDGLGIVAATLPGGDAVAPPNQCINTPFACIPERVGLAATAWAALAEQGANPLSQSPSPVTISTQTLVFGTAQGGGTGSTKSASVTNTGLVPVTVSVSVTGANPGSFSATGCSIVLSPGQSCAVTVTFLGQATGQSRANLAIAQTPSWAVLPTVSNVALSGPPALTFVPVTPCRIADTRSQPDGPFAGPLLTGQTSRDFTIPNSACGIPPTAQAYALNVTVVPNGPLQWLTVWPTGQMKPIVSTLNSVDGRIKANAAIVAAGINGAVSVFATNDTQVILDINGYFVASTTPSSLAFYPLTPCRIADTRSAAGPLGGPSMAAGQTRDYPVLTSACNVPSNAQAYSLNFTVVPKGTLGYLSTWPTGQTRPVVSTLNAPTGTVTANAAILPAGTNGDISVYTTNDTDLVIDINGYFAPPGTNALSFYTMPPCRVFDTRVQAGAQPFTGALNVTFDNTCAVPSTAQSYVLNATVVPSGTLGWLTLWPAGNAQPNVSTLNAYDGAITSNMALVPTIGGPIKAFAPNATHLILDIFGYFAP